MMSKRNSSHREKQPKIVVSQFGEVEERERNRIIGVMKECYDKLLPHDIALVDLYLFERSSLVKAFLAKEYEQVGVASESFDELFFAMHDAWRGTSRIILCLERMEKLARLIQLGGIRHEVGHSVLHGSLQFYLIPLPPVLLKLADRFRLSREYVANILYLISIAVKDYEVSHLLHMRGYVNDQVAYARHLLTTSESDILSWKMSRGNPLAEILCLISYLKSASCTVEFLDDERFGKEMRQNLAQSIRYVPVEYRSLLLRLVSQDFPSLGADTLNNINHIADKCQPLLEAVLTSNDGHREVT